jgi:hypothetical protein
MESQIYWPAFKPNDPMWRLRDPSWALVRDTYPCDPPRQNNPAAVRDANRCKTALG